ncbi:MAG: DMT family transporter [Elusimicrobiota bacterium]
MSWGAHAPGRLSVLAAAVLFSTGGAAIKGCAFSGSQVACLRSAIAALTLVLFLPKTFRLPSWRQAGAAAAYACTVLLFVLANKRTTAANAIFLQSASPLYLLLLAPWLLKERIRARDLALAALMAVGVGLCLLGSAPVTDKALDPGLGNLLAAIAGVCWSFTLLGLRSSAQEGPHDALAVVLLGNALAALASAGWAFPLGSAGLGDWLGIVYLGAVQIGLAYVLLTKGVRDVPALETSLLLLLEPVLNPVWAWLVHGEAPGPWSLAGGAVILTAVLLNTTVPYRVRGLGNNVAI